MTALRIASFQRAPLFDNVLATTTRLLEDLSMCDRLGVDLALFPECYLQGYPSNRREVSERALALNSDAISHLLLASASYNSTFICGFVEKQYDHFYNSAIVVSSGRILGKYAKKHINEDGFSAGTETPIFSVAGHAFAINICNDANYQSAAQAVRDLGAEIICYPLNNFLPLDVAAKWRERSLQNLRQRALESNCWVVSSDVVGTSQTRMSYGCTCVVDPKGNVVAKCSEHVEGCVTMELFEPNKNHSHGF